MMPLISTLDNLGTHSASLPGRFALRHSLHPWLLSPCFPTPLAVSSLVPQTAHVQIREQIHDSHQSPNRGSTLRPKHLHQGPVSPSHRHPFRVDETISPKRPRCSHQRVREIFGKRKAWASGQKPTDGRADSAAAEEGRDIQVLWCSAGENEWVE